MRERALDLLEHLDLDSPNALVRRGFVFGLVLQNELQSQEAMLEALQLRIGSLVPGAVDVSHPDRAPSGPDEIHVPGGAFTLGAEHEPWAYDNELEAHEIELRPFVIDRAPVTNAQFAEFVDGRGYRSQKHWSDAGLGVARARGRARAALLGGRKRRLGARALRRARAAPADRARPARLLLRGRGVRALGGQAAPDRGRVGARRRRGTTTRASSGTRGGRRGWASRRASTAAASPPLPPARTPAASARSAASRWRGDVWEWTSSAFQPYPGFVAFPYPECSEVNFGDDVRVLRGGSWATDGLVARASFRRWEHPGAARDLRGLPLRARRVGR